MVKYEINGEIGLKIEIFRHSGLGCLLGEFFFQLKWKCVAVGRALFPLEHEVSATSTDA